MVWNKTGIHAENLCMRHARKAFRSGKLRSISLKNAAAQLDGGLLPYERCVDVSSAVILSAVTAQPWSPIHPGDLFATHAVSRFTVVVCLPDHGCALDGGPGD